MPIPGKPPSGPVGASLPASPQPENARTSSERKVAKHSIREMPSHLNQGTRIGLTRTARALAAAGVLAFIVLTTSDVRGEPGPGPPDIIAMVASSDVIAVGRAVSQSTAPDGSAGKVLLHVVVDRILKGDLPGRSFGTVGQRVGAGPWVPMQQTRLFFLNKVAGGLYAGVNADYLSLGASDLPLKGLNGYPDTVTNVAGELVRVLATPPSVLVAAHPEWKIATGARQMLPPDESLHAFSSDDRASRVRRVVSADTYLVNDTLWETSQALLSIPVQNVRPPVMAALGQNVSENSRIWLISSLVGLGDLSQISSISRSLMNPKENTIEALGWFASALEVGIGISPSAEVVPVLSGLLRSTDVDIRRAAAYALRDIHADAILRPLASMALHDDDGEVRYFAVSGLCAQTGRCPIPGGADFKAHEAKYLADWTEWRAENLKQ